MRFVRAAVLLQFAAFAGAVAPVQHGQQHEQAKHVAQQSAHEEPSVPEIPLELGVQLQLRDLHANPALNGQVGTLVAVDTKTRRLVVELSDGSHKEFRERNVKALAPAMAETKQLVVCNAYPASKTLGVYYREGEDSPAEKKIAAHHKTKVTWAQMASDKHHAPSFTRRLRLLQEQAKHMGKQSYSTLTSNLNFQACQQVPWPKAVAKGAAGAVGKLKFAVNKLQVAEHAVDSRQLPPGGKLVLVVFRDDTNSLKAGVLAAVVDPGKAPLQDQRATLLVFNAYTGGRFLQLHAKTSAAGHPHEQEVKFNKQYRLQPRGEYQLALTDGFGHLDSSFQVAARGVYVMVVTGVEAGLRGEPHPMGMLSHASLTFGGSFSSAEELSPPPPAPAPVEVEHPHKRRHRHRRHGLAAFLFTGSEEEDDDPFEESSAVSACWRLPVAMAMGLLFARQQ